jgi:hypothetical protein
MKEKTELKYDRKGDLLIPSNVPIDLYIGIFFFILTTMGLLSFFTTPLLYDAPDMGFDPGPSILPKLTLLILTISALFYTSKGLIEYKYSIKSDLVHFYHTNLRPLQYFISIFTVILLIEYIHFSILVFIFSFVWIYIQEIETKIVKKSAAISALVLALFISLFIHIVFIYSLGISI